jgi:hypothetical protein
MMPKMKTIMLATALTLVSGAAMAAGHYGSSYGANDPAFADTSDPNSAPSTGWNGQGNWNGGYAQSGWNRGRNRGYDSYASGREWNGGTGAGPGSYGYQAQSGGNGSPASAGSIRGSTDRSSPNSPFASGPYGDGERY